eukprot:TRINITY_DN4852_c0_g1_i1.p1 TRINITY_DN4852_c0_g1~~TRINITY_DN4852_c0_g1_i1.p1  ORF type:complete len:225 (-),score=18.36 TRINITY_DN4852_c0_g1_i1:32-706(-)
MQKSLVFVVVLSLVILCHALKADKGVRAEPPAPLWPSTWSGNWQFYDTKTGAVTQKGAFYYDWAHGKVLRQDNNDGECFPGWGSARCTFIFRNNTIFLVDLDDGYCCDFYSDIGPTPPNYLSDSSYKGYGSFKFTPKVNTSVWDHASTKETYYQTIGSQPMPYVLEGGGDAMLFGGYSLAPISPSTFALPEDCWSFCIPEKRNLAKMPLPQDVPALKMLLAMIK